MATTVYEREIRSAELAITSLISNKREWNIFYFNFLELQKIGSTKYERNPLDEDAMLCNTLWSDRRRLITFSRTSKRRN